MLASSIPTLTQTPLLKSSELMSSDCKPISRVPLVRWRKTLILLAAAVLAFIFLGGQHLLSESLEISRSKIVDYISSRPKVDEIYGLIHLVTSGIEEQDRLTEAADGDPTKPIDLSVYAEGRQIDWRKEVKRLDTKYPIVVFSKVSSPFLIHLPALIVLLVRPIARKSRDYSCEFRILSTLHWCIL